LHSGPRRVGFAIAVLALPTALIGIASTPLAQLATLVAILVVGAIVDAAITDRYAIR
jgi:hypothetical protein